MSELPSTYLQYYVVYQVQFPIDFALRSAVIWSTLTGRLTVDWRLNFRPWFGLGAV